MIESARGVVVAGGIAGGDVVGHVQAASDLVENLPLEHVVCGRRLLGFYLRWLPTLRREDSHVRLKLHGRHRLDLSGISAGGSIGLHHHSQVRRGLCCQNNRRCVPAKLREQWQGRQDIGQAAMLARPIGAEAVDNRLGIDTVIFSRQRSHATAGVPAENVVLVRIAKRVQDDPIDGRLPSQEQIGRGNLVGLDEPDVQVHSRLEAPIREEYRERFAVGRPSHSHGSQLARQVHRLGPGSEVGFDLAVNLRVVGEHLKTRACADAVVGQCQHDPAGVRIVGHLVACPAAEYSPDIYRAGLVGGKIIRIGPVAAVVGCGLSRVEFRPQHHCVARGFFGMSSPWPTHNYTLPGGTIFARVKALAGFFAAAALPARYLSASIWSFSEC